MELQTSRLIPILKKLGLWVLQIGGVEADDLIGMASEIFSKKGWEVRIYAKDNDLFQLTKENVSVWPDLKLAPLWKKDIEKWLGAPLEALTTIKALAGDSSDNLKGLPRIGFATAQKMWQAGIRLGDKKKPPKWKKEISKEDWARVHEEYRLVQIIRDPQHPLWGIPLSKALCRTFQQLRSSPDRNRELAEENRREFYRFLSIYELNEVLGERHKFFRLP